MADAPLIPNPSGGPSNFVDPPSLNGAVAASGIALIVASGFCLSLRIYTNATHTGRLGLDDLLVLFSEASGIAKWGIMYSLTLEDHARHTWDIPRSTLTKSVVNREAANQMFSAPALWAAKAAILVMYIRLFGSKRWMRLWSWGLIAVMGVVYLAAFVIAAITALKNASKPLLERNPQPIPGVGMVAVGVFGLVTDIAVFVLPLMPIMRLQLNQRKKIGLLVVFLMAFLTIVTSGVALYYRVIVARANDVTWDGAKATIATLAEIFGTVIVGCGPALSSFWKNVFKKTRFYSNAKRILSLKSTSATLTGDRTGAPNGVGSRRNQHYGKLGEGYEMRNGGSGLSGGTIGGTGASRKMGISRETAITVDISDEHRI